MAFGPTPCPCYVRRRDLPGVSGQYERDQGSCKWISKSLSSDVRYGESGGNVPVPGL